MKDSVLGAIGALKFLREALMLQVIIYPLLLGTRFDKHIAHRHRSSSRQLPIECGTAGHSLSRANSLPPFTNANVTLA